MIETRTLKILLKSFHENYSDLLKKQRGIPQNFEEYVVTAPRWKDFICWAQNASSFFFSFSRNWQFIFEQLQYILQNSEVYFFLKHGRIWQNMEGYGRRWKISKRILKRKKQGKWLIFLYLFEEWAFLLKIRIWWRDQLFQLIKLKKALKTFKWIFKCVNNVTHCAYNNRQFSIFSSKKRRQICPFSPNYS